MAVIINDFEIQVEAPDESGEGQQPAPESPALQRNRATLTPMDLEDVQRRQEERQQRLWAH